MLALVCIGYFLTGCEEDTFSVCDDYCKTAQGCAQLNGTWFSVSRCERDCEDEREGYALMDCGEPFLDLRECQADLSCAALGDVGDKCAGEIDLFNLCVD
jgi:hypothetical protein